MKSLTAYLAKREVAIDFLLRMPRRGYDRETFHQLRIEIKKLLPLFDLLKYCDKKFKRRKTFKPFRRIFRQAGKVRELQVEEQILEEHVPGHALIEYRRALKDKAVNQKHKFFALLNDDLFIRIRKKSHDTAKQLNSISRKKSEKYLHAKISKVHRLTDRGSVKPGEAHRLRKALKSIQYSRNCLGLKGKTFKRENALTPLLGEWHDCDEIVKHLDRAVLRTTIEKQQLDELKNVRKRISSRRDELFVRINFTLKGSDLVKV